jgi:hypothetical protein
MESQVNFTVSEKELQAALIDSWHRRKSYIWGTTIIQAIILVMLLAVGLVLFYDGKIARPLYYAALLIAIGATILLLPLVARLLYIRQGVNRLKHYHDGRIEFTFDDRGFQWTDQLSTIQLRWDMLNAIGQNKDMLFLELQPQCILSVPLKVFPPDSRDQLIRTIARTLSEQYAERGRLKLHRVPSGQL